MSGSGAGALWQGGASFLPGTGRASLTAASLPRGHRGLALHMQRGTDSWPQALGRGSEKAGGLGLGTGADSAVEGQHVAGTGGPRWARLGSHRHVACLPPWPSGSWPLCLLGVQGTHPLPAWVRACVALGGRAREEARLPCGCSRVAAACRRGADAGVLAAGPQPRRAGESVSLGRAGTAGT